MHVHFLSFLLVSGETQAEDAPCKYVRTVPYLPPGLWMCCARTSISTEKVNSVHVSSARAETVELSVDR